MGERLKLFFAQLSLLIKSISTEQSQTCVMNRACQARTRAHKTIWPIVRANKFVDDNTYTFDCRSCTRRFNVQLQKTNGKALTTRSSDQILHWCVEIGHCFMTKDTEEFSQIIEPVACREYTLLPRDEKSSDPKGWIRGNTKVGPVLEVTTSYPQGKYGVEIRIESENKDESHSWSQFLMAWATTKRTITTSKTLPRCSSTILRWNQMHVLLQVDQRHLFVNQELNRISLSQWHKDWILFFVMVIFLEKDGAIEFWRSSEWVGELSILLWWNVEECNGRNNKKRFQYCTDLHDKKNWFWTISWSTFYHVRCAINLHSIEGEWQTVFCTAVKTRIKMKITQKIWKKYKKTVYLIDRKLTHQKRIEILLNKIERILATHLTWHIPKLSCVFKKVPQTWMMKKYDFASQYAVNLFHEPLTTCLNFKNWASNVVTIDCEGFCMSIEGQSKTTKKRICCFFTRKFPWKKELDVVEPGTYSLSLQIRGVEESLRLHNKCIEEDGAVHSWKIQSIHWSDGRWKACFGSRDQKKFQYSADDSWSIVSFWALQGHSGNSLIDPSLQNNVIIPNRLHSSCWMCNPVTFHHQFWIDAWRSKFEQQTDSVHPACGSHGQKP